MYDADGNLLLEKDPGTTTLYLPGEQIALNTTTGVVTGTRFYQLPGDGQVVRTGAGSAYAFQLTDQHGTATLTIGPDLTAASAAWRELAPPAAPQSRGMTTSASWASLMTPVPA